jgi:hypothetical protein
MSKTEDTLKSDVISRGVSDDPTAEATARYISEHSWTRNVISRGRVVQRMGDRKKDGLDWKVADLMGKLYLDAQCGCRGAEYNLERAGLIEMLFGHVAGHLDDGDYFWDDVRWTLTDRGRRASVAKLELIIVRDPPLEIALSDAEDEAKDLASDCVDCKPGGAILMTHHRRLAHLERRVERILAQEKRNRRATARSSSSTSIFPRPKRSDPARRKTRSGG